MLVHAVLEVPDGTVIDNRLPAQIIFNTYTEGGLVTQAKEGYLSPFREDVLSRFEIESMDVGSESVIIVRYPDDCSPEEINMMISTLKLEIPDHVVLGITKELGLLVENSKEAIDMLERMIAHVKVKSGVSNNIVLP